MIQKYKNLNFKIMKIVYITKKGELMKILERFYNYDETKKSNQIKDKYLVKQNVIFDTILRASTDRGHHTH
jgi:hypothetical protein